MSNHSAADKQAARQLRNCYQYERARLQCVLDRDVDYRVPSCWGPGDRPGPEARRTSVWLRLARSCRLKGINPLRYIQWCLHVDQVLLDSPPEPNLLLQAARMDAFRAARVKEIRKIAIKWQIHATVFSTNAVPRGKESKEDAAAYALTHLGLQLSPLFRYCRALLFGGQRFVKIARRFEAEALLQYQYDAEVYGRLVGGIAPDDFAQRARLYYAQCIDDYDARVRAGGEHGGR